MNKVFLPRRRAASQGTANRGFTLIELMIVVAVVGLLTAIAYPSYQKYILKSRRSDAKNAVLDLASREERFFSVNNAYTSNAASLGYGAGSAFPIPVNASGTSYYTLSVTASAGTSTSLPGYVGTATPTGAQVADTTCYAFRVDQSGTQSNLDSGGAALATTGCW